MCSKSFKKEVGLLAHKRIMHKDMKEFECGTCKSMFTGFKELVNHIKVSLIFLHC